jgi:hypothetical protein
MKKHPFLRPRCLLALTAITVPGSLLFSWGVTEVTEGEHTWQSAPWTNGIPGEQDTVYIREGAKILLKGEVKAHGLRLGSTPKQMPVLQVEAGSLATRFLVVADAVNANANFIQAGGSLMIEDTSALDFEIGNPGNIPTEASYAIATFAAGTAHLADLRINLRQHRKSRLALFGVLPDVTANSLTFATGKETEWQAVELQFVLSDAGIAPLKVTGTADFGPGDRAHLIVEGSRYKGEPGTYSLVEAGQLLGQPKELRLEGFNRPAEIQQVENRILLIIR